MDLATIDRLRYIISLTNKSELEIRGEKKNAELVKIRQMIMYFCREELGLSLVEIGRFLNRDHSTIIYGVRKFGDILSIPNRNLESDRYNRILNEYRKKYVPTVSSSYVCSNSLLSELNKDLEECKSSKTLTPIKQLVNNARIAQLNKCISIVNKLSKGSVQSLNN